MGFRINTNIAAMNAHRNATQTNLGLDKSLNSLSSGLRINKAADDASGMSIADSLRSQANGLGQAIRNANDGIAVVQTADGALDEYINIIDRVRTLSIQSASDGQNITSRKAIQNDISKLLEEAQNIATTTSFNGLNLLDGNFTNKNFQIGAYANETVTVSIGNVQTDSVGAFAEKEGAVVTTDALATGNLTVNGVAIDASVAGTGTGRTTSSAWSKANAINVKTASTGVTATATTTQTGTAAVTAGTIAAGDLVINGIDIGLVAVTDNDADSALINAINAKSGTSHVTASLDASSQLVLTASDGEDIVLTGANSTDAITHTGDNTGTITTTGKITLSSTSSSIAIGGTQPDYIGFNGAGETIAETGNLAAIDVTTYAGAQTAIKTSDAALQEVDAIRSDIGSTQNQLESTIRNISVTQVNVTAAESQIRDVDFAAESANFAKLNILAQSGSYAMSQANAVQQNVLRLLQ
ncbi:MAG: flagellin [Nanoarchaeota archaeon]|nr:flagellin [Nanoarchaeota archaeon]